MSGSTIMLHYIKGIAVRLWKDERGASLLEYAVLIGIILAVSVTAVFTVGNWAGGQWKGLVDTLSGKGSPPLGTP
jgi:Flp pilus assembly pilin Flp